MTPATHVELDTTKPGRRCLDMQAQLWADDVRENLREKQQLYEQLYHVFLGGKAVHNWQNYREAKKASNWTRIMRFHQLARAAGQSARIQRCYADLAYVVRPYIVCIALSVLGSGSRYRHLPLVPRIGMDIITTSGLKGSEGLNLENLVIVSMGFNHPTPFPWTLFLPEEGTSSVDNHPLVGTTHELDHMLTYR
ncbi:unnamed protein product [Heligmosomoides polygyrus]|uniref:Uncharacterized protein n=1 Tax=Heligmosomoides polygyrus TaxID=6339 RepID=A0A183G3A0_HELPZ|nr:unnamed protein product [Heligmosomoides polygyrus]